MSCRVPLMIAPQPESTASVSTSGTVRRVCIKGPGGVSRYDFSFGPAASHGAIQCVRSVNTSLTRDASPPASSWPDGDTVVAEDSYFGLLVGSANATYVPPDSAPFFPPPHAITTYSRPSTM